MAHTQTFIWTVAPNNVARDAAGASFLRLSVFVTPRLAATAGAAARLADYPDVLDWPAAVNGMRFTVGFGNGVVVAPASVRRVRPAPLRDTSGVEITNPWAELFDQNTPVRSFVFADYSTKRKLTYDVPDTGAVVRERHGQVADAETPGDAEPPAPAGAAAPAVTAANAAGRLAEAEGFQRAIERVPAGPAASDVTEFHSLIATLCGYPEIARMLALIVDLEVPTPAELPADGKVSVFVSWDPQLPREITPAGEWRDTTFNRSPWTHYRLRADVGKFLPASRADDVDNKNGMLALARAVGGTPLYDVSHFDVHAEALKLRSFDTQAGPDHAEFPSLRSAGVGVSRAGLRDVLQTNFSWAAANNARIADNQMSEVNLYAADLARGYRVDVNDAPGVWRSLCRRAGTYTFKRSGRKVQLEDEGWVSLSAVRAAVEGDGDPSRLAIHETIFRWDGWSLCVKRPGKSVVPEGQPLGEGETAESRLFSATFRVPPRSLPRLRFGKPYSLRARVVDVAGNSHPVDDEVDALDPDVVRVLDGVGDHDIPYVRYDPVPSPVPVLREALTDADGATLPGKEGESFERIVLRTNAAGVQTPSRRHLVPPRISQADAETHGLELFDAPVGLKPEAYTRIVELDRPLKVVHEEQQIELPYLPDPLAHTAALFGLPGHPVGAPYVLPFVRDNALWPQAKTWQLVLTDGNGAPSPANPSTAADNVITVFLPKAEVRTVRVSSLLRAADLEKMGLWHLFMKRHGAATANSFFKPRIIGPVAYCHERFNICRELVLIHAVQVPLFAPEYLVPAGGGAPLRVVRAKGETAAALICDMRLPAKSASRVDLLANWNEYRDEVGPGRRPDRPVPVHAKAFDIPLLPLPGRENETRPDVELCKLRGPGEELPQGPDPTLMQVGRQHEFGDTKHRRVTYVFSATTRFADFFPEGTSPLTNDSTPRSVHVPSSARPSAPEPLYVIPTFRWTKTTADTATTRVYTHKRAGSGARVYLKRPWFSSGEDELLGVVASADPIGPNIPESVEPYLTRMGSDVIWPPESQARPPGYPRASRFKSALDAAASDAIRNQGGVIGEPLPLEEAGGYLVDLVCHRVQYNPERQLWFADIVINPNDPRPPYFPFLKLALVRYQPFALDGLHVSPLAVADSVQLAPDRTTRLTINNTNQVEVEVTGSFVADSIVTVSLERPRSFVPDQHLGWLPGPVTDEPLTTSDAGPLKRWRKTLSLGSLIDYRVVVKEVETVMSDTGPYKRLVYADIFRSNEQ